MTRNKWLIIVLVAIVGARISNGEHCRVIEAQVTPDGSSLLTVRSESKVDSVVALDSSLSRVHVRVDSNASYDLSFVPGSTAEFLFWGIVDWSNNGKSIYFSSLQDSAPRNLSAYFPNETNDGPPGIERGEEVIRVFPQSNIILTRQWEEDFRANPSDSDYMSRYAVRSLLTMDMLGTSGEVKDLDLRPYAVSAQFGDFVVCVERVFLTRRKTLVSINLKNGTRTEIEAIDSDYESFGYPTSRQTLPFIQKREAEGSVVISQIRENNGVFKIDSPSQDALEFSGSDLPKTEYPKFAGDRFVGYDFGSGSITIFEPYSTKSVADTAAVGSIRGMICNNQLTRILTWGDDQISVLDVTDGRVVKRTGIEVQDIVGRFAETARRIHSPE